METLTEPLETPSLSEREATTAHQKLVLDQARLRLTDEQRIQAGEITLSVHVSHSAHMNQTR